jgi:hypothetical protein
MKKVFGLAILAMSILIVSCKNNNELSISGKVENAGAIKKVLLYETDQLVDSAFLNENNEFKFRRVTEEPDFYTLLVGEKNFLLVGKNGDELDFKTTLILPTAMRLKVQKNQRKSGSLIRLEIVLAKFIKRYRMIIQE